MKYATQSFEMKNLKNKNVELLIYVRQPWSRPHGFVEYIHWLIYMELYLNLIRFRSDNGSDFVMLSLDIAIYQEYY